MLCPSPFHSPVITCPTDGVISAPENGDVSVGEITLGSVATYTCNDGYVFNGDSTRTCQADGTWSGDKPICGES